MEKSKEIHIDKEIVVAGCAAFGSVLGYYIMKSAKQDPTPATFIGGAVGTLFAIILEKTT